MKLPSSVGQKKIKALEQMLLELGVGEWGLGRRGYVLWLASSHPLALPTPSTHHPQS